jgi:hypothetical protein
LAAALRQGPRYFEGKELKWLVQTRLEAGFLRRSAVKKWILISDGSNNLLSKQCVTRKIVQKVTDFLVID